MVKLRRRPAHELSPYRCPGSGHSAGRPLEVQGFRMAACSECGRRVLVTGRPGRLRLHRPTSSVEAVEDGKAGTVAP
jgi:DNA-directed RNA polymerase subunit RPC12/RpoP